jgi:hypothetical protein
MVPAASSELIVATRPAKGRRARARWIVVVVGWAQRAELGAAGNDSKRGEPRLRRPRSYIEKIVGPIKVRCRANEVLGQDWEDGRARA